MEIPKLTEQVLSKSSNRFRYVKMLYPEGWSINIRDRREDYGGYGYPWSFTVTLTSPDNTAAIYYYSPRNFIDDHLKQRSEDEIDDWGNLYRSFTPVNKYLFEMAERFLSNYEYSLLRTYEDPNIQARADRRKEASLKKAGENGEILNDHYFREQCQIWRYRNKGTMRTRCYSAIVEGSDVTTWSDVPVDTGIFGFDLFMRQTVMSVFPNARRDPKTGKYIYTSESEIDWEARKILCMDCQEKDLDALYENVFRPVVDHGVFIQDDVWEDYRRVRKENEARYAEIREEKRRVAKIEQQARDEQLQRNKELQDYLRKTQNEIHDIQRSSYENTQRTQAKISEQWGDVNRGNTRFVDRHGDEHVIHTYNDYAYKRGDTYVTSDSPLDPGWDWEELEKKKYD